MPRHTHHATWPFPSLVSPFRQELGKILGFNFTTCAAIESSPFKREFILLNFGEKGQVKWVAACCTFLGDPASGGIEAVVVGEVLF